MPAKATVKTKKTKPYAASAAKRAKKPPATVETEPIKGEVYAGAIADDYWTRGWCPANPDDLVAKKGLKVYRTMMKREPVIRMGLEMLERSRLSTGFRVVAGDGPRGEEIAEKTKVMFTGASSKPSELFHDLLEARPVGFVIMEKVPVAYTSGPLAGMWGFSSYRSLWQEEFELADDGFGNLDHVKQTNPSAKGVNEWRGQDKIRQKFIVYVPDKEKGSWYGCSILRPIYRAYTSKDYLQRSANVAADRFGGGTISAVLPPGSSQDQLTTVRDALQQHHGSPAHTFLAGTDFNVSYPPGGAFEGFLSLINAYNAEMLMGLGIPTTMIQGTGSDGEGGSLALSRTHKDNYVVVVDRVGRGLEECVDDQIFKQFVDWNWPDVQPDEYPHLRFGAFSDQDQRLRGEVLTLAQKLGLPLSIKNVREDLGAVAPIDEADALKPEDGSTGDSPQWGGESDEANRDEREAREKFSEKRDEGRALFEDQYRRVTEYEEKVGLREMEAIYSGAVAAALAKVEAASAEIRDVAVDVVKGLAGE